MMFGDVIKSVNGKKASTRTEAQELLFTECQASQIKVEYERGGKTFEVVLEGAEADEKNYPYRPAGYPDSRAHPMGIILIDDFNPMWVVKLLKKLATVKARNILLMTSAIMEPLVASILEVLPGVDKLLGERNLHLWVPEHRFWGGNIIIGDLYTCFDYIEGANDFERERSIKPDLIVIPGSFSPNRNTDLIGVSYSTIEQKTGASVIVAECSQITM